MLQTTLRHQLTSSPHMYVINNIENRFHQICIQNSEVNIVVVKVSCVYHALNYVLPIQIRNRDITLYLGCLFTRNQWIFSFNSKCWISWKYLFCNWLKLYMCVILGSFMPMHGLKKNNLQILKINSGIHDRTKIRMWSKKGKSIKVHTKKRRAIWRIIMKCWRIKSYMTNHKKMLKNKQLYDG